MRKLRLAEDELHVESFSTEAENDPPAGTVFGRETDSCTCLPNGTCFYNDCGVTYTCPHFDDTCNDTCNCGLTYTCATGNYTDCPGQTQCAPYTQDVTCYGSCTDQGCTACGAVC